MNGPTREVVHRGWVDEEYVAAHTQGFEALCEVVTPCDPQRVADICGITAVTWRPPEVFGTSERVLSTVLQGFYQSHQATASAIGVNNLHLLRGIGRPGAGILQMNGQPTAQNNREAGADGDLSGFRNWQNEEHVRELAELWDVDPMTIQHWSEPTHVMQILRYIEQGSIGFLWVSGTNPAMSLPELARARELLAPSRCSWSSTTATRPRPPTWPTSCCPAPCGVSGRARTRTSTAPCTCRTRLWTRRERRAVTWTSGSTTRPDGFHREEWPADPRSGHLRGRLRSVEGVFAGPPVRQLRPQQRLAP